MVDVDVLVIVLMMSIDVFLVSAGANIFGFLTHYLKIIFVNLLEIPDSYTGLFVRLYLVRFSSLVFALLLSS